MVDLTFDSADLDSATSESGVAHESTADTDLNDASELVQGASMADPVAAADLAGHIPLQDNDATEITGTATTTVSGATANVGGIGYGSAFDFDGVDDVIDCGTQLLPTDTRDPFSISCWVNPDTTDTAEHQIVAQEDGGDSNFEGPFMSLDDNRWEGHLRTQSGGSDVVREVTRSNSSSTSTWYHVVVTYDGSKDVSGLRVYENGQEPTTVTTKNQPISNNYGATENTSIGARDPNGSTSTFYDGQITDVRIYNKALSSSEVDQIYNAYVTAGTLTTPTKTA